MKYLTQITRTVESFVTFTSQDVMTGNSLLSYQVPLILTKGTRQHRTKQKALAHIAAINKEFGEGTAIYIGKSN